jgi:hypothetical protein
LLAVRDGGTDSRTEPDEATGAGLPGPGGGFGRAWPA